MVESILYFLIFIFSVSICDILLPGSVIPLPAHRLMFRGIGINFRSINAHVAQLNHIHFGGDEQDLGEQVPDRFQEPPPERANGIVVGAFYDPDHTSRFDREKKAA